MPEALEEETPSDVTRIEREDAVGTNPETGRPKVQKGVDTSVTPRQQRYWTWSGSGKARP
ncbi:hypothetical protein D3F03_16345 [Simplicispira hankyongi]|uniref:Uncharacterized protein n=1 Tax=Simplicispira hankyongi TaxID=2315688 RepID=A0A398C713_9BURK|nr:hypothetical protein D3F03_16345 [Simplicispira hankyongi]